MTSKKLTIILNEDEERYLVRVIFGPRNSTHESREAALKLTYSLLERKAVPEIRVKYFTDPKFHIGRTKKSRRHIFESNGTSGDHIFRHSDFLKYLHYFIYGPELPSDTIDGFLQLIDENTPVTSGDVESFQQYARSETRSHGLAKREASEEFYKLALETELRLYARNIRDSVMRLKV